MFCIQWFLLNFWRFSNTLAKCHNNLQIEKFKFKGLEGDWINFEWIDISNIDNYEIYPNGIKETIKNPNKIYHYIENLTK